MVIMMKSLLYLPLSLFSITFCVLLTQELRSVFMIMTTQWTSLGTTFLGFPLLLYILLYKVQLIFFFYVHLLFVSFFLLLMALFFLLPFFYIEHVFHFSFVYFNV